jgi:2-oxoglutarate dehydrogenase E2 component (dihydrolipoamide succinyltransferase)
VLLVVSSGAIILNAVQLPEVQLVYRSSPPLLVDRITPTAELPDIAAIAGPSLVASFSAVVVHPVPGWNSPPRIVCPPPASNRTVPVGGAPPLPLELLLLLEPLLPLVVAPPPPPLEEEEEELPAPPMPPVLELTVVEPVVDDVLAPPCPPAPPIPPLLPEEDKELVVPLAEEDVGPEDNELLELASAAPPVPSSFPVAQL